MKDSREIPQKSENGSTKQMSHSTSGNIFKEMKCANERVICTLKFIAAQLAIAKLSNKPRCPSNDIWIDCDIHMIKYHSAIKWNEILTFSTKWMQLEITVVNEPRPVPKRQIYFPDLHMW